MAKKNSTAKDTELSLSFFGKVAALFRSETVHFVIGLVLVIFSVYLLLAFSSFFFTGAADQSIIDGGSAQELISTNNGVKNYAGSRGAQLASYLINDCFGVSSFLILVFLAVAGLKLMREVVHRLFVDAGVVLGIFRFCVCRPVQGLFPLSGRYARIQCQQLACVSSRCAGSMAAIVGNCHLLPHLSECTDCHLVAQIVQSQLLEA